MGEPQNPFDCTNLEPSSNSSSSSFSSSPPLCIPDKKQELQDLEHTPQFWRNLHTKRRLSKQLSMCEAPRNIAWERRRRQFLLQEQRRNAIATQHEGDDLTDEDLNELKGCIELGFGFNEKNGQRLCPTIPALDLYFAVNRQVPISPMSSPASTGSTGSLGSPTLGLGPRSSSFGSPMTDSDSLKIFNRGIYVLNYERNNLYMLIN